jgi:hypothetical protein
LAFTKTTEQRLEVDAEFHPFEHRWISEWSNENSTLAITEKQSFLKQRTLCQFLEDPTLKGTSTGLNEFRERTYSWRWWLRLYKLAEF